MIQRDSLLEKKKYKSYQKSGADWLKSIPSSWNTLKMKRIFSPITIKDKPNEKLLSVTQDQGVVPREWVENRMVMPSGNLDSFKYIKKGQFAISLRSFEGGLEYCHKSGIISPSYTVLRMDKDFNPHYYKHLFKSSSFIAELQSSVVGIRDGKNINYPSLSYSVLPIPPIEEQNRIANFLDEKNQKIKNLIDLKKKIINNLFELISVFVLTGRKDASSVPELKNWLKSYPEEWQTEKAKYIFVERKETNRGNEELLSVTQDNGVIYKSDTEKNYVTPSGDLSNMKLVKPNDYVISLRSFQGGIETSDIQGIVSPAYNVFHLKEQFQNEALQAFYKYLFKTPRFINMLNSLVASIRDGKNISFDDFANLEIPKPKQNQVSFILDYLDRYERAKSSFIEEKKKLIEYKKALTDKVVTGKIKV